MLAQYDHPWKFYGRRNEFWIPYTMDMKEEDDMNKYDALVENESTTTDQTTVVDDAQSGESEIDISEGSTANTDMDEQDEDVYSVTEEEEAESNPDDETESASSEKTTDTEEEFRMQNVNQKNGQPFYDMIFN
jgi:hypothetical protein